MFSPTPHRLSIITEAPTLRRRLKLLINWKNARTKKYSGHYAVTRSIIEGLQSLDVAFNYNPCKSNIAETVFVPANYAALSYALKLKNLGIIKKIIAGPNLAVLPSEIINVPDHVLIDVYLQPSDWVVHLWQQLDPQFPLPLKVWYAGVDTDYWKPSSLQKNTKQVLLYKKHVPEDFFISCKELLEQKGFVVEVIAYGSYTADLYREALQRNSILVHLTESESQGISLAEAWATNTPTIVWNPKHFKYGEVIYNDSSSAPYLTNDTGAFFTTTEQLSEILSSWQSSQYSPRKWCLENMSDEVCAQRLLSIIDAV